MRILVFHHRKMSKVGHHHMNKLTKWLVECWGGPANGGAGFSTFYGSRNGPFRNAILWSLAVSLFCSFHQCQGRFEVSLWSRCGLVVVSLWSRRFITIYHSHLLMWSRCGLAFHGFHQCQWRFEVGDSGNYNTIERSPPLTFPTNHSEF